MRSKIQRWGNSLAVRIPKSFAEEVGLKDDSPIELRLEKGGLVVEPIAPWGRTLDELLDDVTEENRPAEWDTGRPQGKEVW
jgi:antitoxin MazE